LISPHKHFFFRSCSPRQPPPRSPTAPASGPRSRAGTIHAARLLCLLRKLIDDGTDLARTLQQSGGAIAVLSVALHFGTRDIALLLARITRGLRLANGREAKLVSRPMREAAAPADVRASSDRAQRASQTSPPPLPDMPTAEEIAAARRHRPVGAVIADICHDRGTVMPRRLNCGKSS